MPRPLDSKPLAARMRPRRLDEFVGQTHLLGEGKLLSTALRKNRLPSLIMWGPPGCGKTTLARLVADEVDAQFHPVSAVSGGVADIRDAAEKAGDLRRMMNQPTVLFVDELHRFNKAQQDALLPHVEDGTFILIGATTENPSFEVISALQSRCKMVVLEPLDDQQLGVVVDRALTDERRGLGERALQLNDQARATIIDTADGDARKALNTLELAADTAEDRADQPETTIRKQDVEQALQQRVIHYDKDGAQHYDTVSAFIKSLRGSDPDAAVYYMTRMLEGGEDPLFILRRMVIFASEDIGNADPRALRVALDATESVRFIGLPEGVLPMTQAATYLACAPKSNSALTTYAAARKDVLNHGNLPLPKKILNAPTRSQQKLGHGRGYKYPHNFDGHYVEGEDYLPDELRGRRYYEPDDTETIPRPPGYDDEE